MAGASAFLVRPKAFGNARGEAPRGVQQIIPARGLMPGNGGFSQVAEAIELVVVPQIGERPVAARQGVESVQVAILLLGGADHVHRLLGLGLQSGIGLRHQLIGHGFQPFVAVAVLKHETVEGVLQRLFPFLRQGFNTFGAVGGHIYSACFFRRHGAGGSPHVVGPPGRRGVGNLVVQRFPLVGNHRLANQADFPRPERIGHANVI